MQWRRVLDVAENVDKSRGSGVKDNREAEGDDERREETEEDRREDSFAEESSSSADPLYTLNMARACE